MLKRLRNLKFVIIKWQRNFKILKTKMVPQFKKPLKGKDKRKIQLMMKPVLTMITTIRTFIKKHKIKMDTSE
jgi:hypothetical protein